ncbi:hypothetical protein [Chitinophaga pinensis]|uniref:Uncharacterized protein n=1 Tax=Chitinophaga pinensis (strain ATCC 43595 / DSM 2588 / LMG 13176 / NBRC 15968 / NCIMB 11800 / UQM 2034) TaxID=485918 RepID=A0A979GAF1_CHIPD|nr:hypothetical protein [Chitinophaga pinensis]ACU63776.1 hypothetical protein Cpin_6372 [Chitinophaga pinensis DSM 2588]
MNQKETYEIIIAQKLEQLPVPAMEDAIWDRISAQLDIEMPQTTPSDNTLPDNNAFLNIATLFVLITALSCYLFINFFHQTPEPVTPPPVSTPATTTKDSIWHELPPPALVQPPLPDKQTIEKKTSIQPDTVNTVRPAIVTPAIDSVATDPPEQLIPPPVIIPVPPATDTTPKKKSRGVKGLSDEDYRIAPKKH